MLKYDQSFWEEMEGHEKVKTVAWTQELWNYITLIMLLKTSRTPNK